MLGLLKIEIRIFLVLMEMIIMIICVSRFLCRRWLSYFRLKNIQLGYTFPKQLIQKLRFKTFVFILVDKICLQLRIIVVQTREIGQLSSTDYLSRGLIMVLILSLVQLQEVKSHILK